MFCCPRFVFIVHLCHIMRAPLFSLCFIYIYFCALFMMQGQRDGEVEEEKREKPKTFEGEKLKELTEGESDVIGDVISDVINPNGLPVQNGLDVDVKEFG